MGQSNLNFSLVQKLIRASFEAPVSFHKLVGQNVTRNRSLFASDRRQLMSNLYDALRWRRRIWGDDASNQLDERSFFEELENANNLQFSHFESSHTTTNDLAKALSFPTWLIEKWIFELGFQSTVSLALALNKPAPVTLRVNTLKSDRNSLLKELHSQGVRAQAGRHSPWSIHLLDRINLRSLAIFKKGFFEIQDEGSQKAVFLTDAKPGWFVIDACTRTGGKALALASMMKNHGTIVATDSDARPLDRLKKRMVRNGVKIMEPLWIAQDDPSPLPNFKQKADLVLVDAPCSGLGALRRTPWLKWGLSKEHVESYTSQQLTLLKRYAQWVKPIGRFVYVTCTIHHQENENVLKQFLKERSDFRLMGNPTILRPDVEGTDGFFIAVMEKYQIS